MFDMLKISNAQISSLVFCRGPTLLDIRNQLQSMQILKQQQTKGTMKPSYSSLCWTLVNLSDTDDPKWQVLVTLKAGEQGTHELSLHGPSLWVLQNICPARLPGPGIMKKSPTLFITSHYSPNWRVWAEWNLTRVLVTAPPEEAHCCTVARLPTTPMLGCMKGWLWSGRIWQLLPPSSLLASVWVGLQSKK